MSMLTVAGIGRLVDNPVTKDVNGQSVTEFRIAFGGDKDRGLSAVFCDASIWGRSGQVFADYHGKGDPAYITGRFEVREWTDRDGNTRQSPQIRVADWTFTGSSSKGDNQRANGQQSQNGRGPRGR